MFTRPPELSDETILDCLAEHWGYDARGLEYEAVGFGAHHWRATGPDGDARFLTVHDLTAKRRDATESEDAVFERLTASFAAAAALAGAGLEFVLAPTPTTDGRIVDRVDHRFTLAVHPYLHGEPAGDDGEFQSAGVRMTVLDQVIEVHRATAATAPHAKHDDLAVPHLDDIAQSLDQIGGPWSAGPYGERARARLDEEAAGLQRLLVAYEQLRAEVDQLHDRAVVTHGEPHASNVLVVDGAFHLIDWDTALLAPAERDLWVLEPGDGSVLHAYERTTGLAPFAAALDLYRLWYDLAEIGLYVGELRGPHTDTADIAESWRNLQHFLRPADRWPEIAG